MLDLKRPQQAMRNPTINPRHVCTNFFLKQNCLSIQPIKHFVDDSLKIITRTRSYYNSKMCVLYTWQTIATVMVYTYRKV